MLREEFAMRLSNHVIMLCGHFKNGQPAAGEQSPRKMGVQFLVDAFILHAKEFFEDELNLHERLGAMIHRHLTRLKAMKQMLRQTSAARDDERPKRITAKSALY